LKPLAKDGKLHLTDVVNAETLPHLIQSTSIPQQKHF